jgi:2-dehydropantoate 2-reductase
MKIAVMGSGGVGGYYGGMLAQAGHEVAFIARGAHLEALRARGLEVRSVHGDFTLPSVDATDRPAEVGPVELIIVCVKTLATEGAAEAMRPMVGPETSVLSFQNGIDAAERIGAVVGMEHMVGAATWLSSAIEAPGVIRQVSQFRRIVLGELDGRITPRVEGLAEALQGTGATVEISDYIMKVLWTKFVFISAISGVGSLTRLPIGDYRSVAETRTLLVALMAEVTAVSLASDIELDPDVIDGVLNLLDNAGPDIKPSMQRDVEAGRCSELDSMVGIVGRKGRELDVPTPAADMVYAALLPGELKAREQDR